VLRRMQPREQDTLPSVTIGDITIDPAARTVLRNNTLVELTTVEFDLLHTFLSAAGRVVTREDISQRVLGRRRRSSVCAKRADGSPREILPRAPANGYFSRSTASARRAIETPAARDWACPLPPRP
jgi:Transcriptional regulatory protein, C terminal